MKQLQKFECSDSDAVQPDLNNHPPTENKTGSASRFRYAYLCRLIDDSDLRRLTPSVRNELRRAHKQAFWKNLSLMRRDAGQILQMRRARMAAEQNWDFTTLVADYLRIQYLLGALTLAGVGHSTRISIGLERARVACSEFEALLVPNRLPAMSIASA